MSAVTNTMRFYHHESCGQCTPCREGTGWLEKVAHKFHAGHAHAGDADLLADVAKNMRGRTICVLADAAAMPMQSYLQHFRGEFEKRVREPAHEQRMRSARDEYTLAAKRETLNHGAPSVTDVGSEMEGV
jgi:NADH-quinone oxidoreductase subunit F